MPKANITSKEHYARLSYLYQLSMVTSASHKSEPLSRFYGSTMKCVARKNVLRLSPTVKRSICKKCYRVLNSQSCSTRMVNESKANDSHNDILQVKCKCGWIKRYPVGRDQEFKLWSDRVESIKI